MHGRNDWKGGVREDGCVGAGLVVDFERPSRVRDVNLPAHKPDGNGRCLGRVQADGKSRNETDHVHDGSAHSPPPSTIVDTAFIPPWPPESVLVDYIAVPPRKDSATIPPHF